MVAALIQLVITLLIVGVIWWAVTEILKVIPVPEPIRRVIHVVLILILALILIYVLMGLLGAPLNLPRLR